MCVKKVSELVQGNTKEGMERGLDHLEEMYYKQPNIYRQPGLLCTPQNFAPSSKFLGKKNFFWY